GRCPPGPRLQPHRNRPRPSRRRPPVAGRGSPGLPGRVRFRFWRNVWAHLLSWSIRPVAEYKITGRIWPIISSALFFYSIFILIFFFYLFLIFVFIFLLFLVVFFVLLFLFFLSSYFFLLLFSSLFFFFFLFIPFFFFFLFS